MKEIDFTYRANHTPALFHRNDAFVRGIMGPVGSGKSTACCWEIMARALRQKKSPDGYRRSRWVVIRNTYRELEDTTLNTWFECFPKEVGSWIQHRMMHKLIFGDVLCEVLFRALDRPDDVKKLLSLELTGAWVNEAKEVPRGIIDMLQARVGRYPRKRDGGPSWYGVFMDTNPPDSESWWYRLFEVERPPEWKLFRQPSAQSKHAENLDNLPKLYYERMTAGKDEEWVRVYVQGEYGYVADGKPVHPRFHSRTHVLDVEPNPNHRVPLLLGADFGLTPALVILQERPGGGFVAVDEVTTEDTGASTFARECVTKLNSEYAGFVYEGYGDPSGDSRSPTNESETVFTVLADEGLDLSPSPDRSNDPVLRIETVNTLLATVALDGAPALLISPRCTRLIKGLGGGYHFKRVNTHGEERFHEKPFKNVYSHVCEALQYALVGVGASDILLEPTSARRPHVSRGPKIGGIRLAG